MNALLKNNKLTSLSKNQISENQNIYHPKKKNNYIKKQALNINEQEKQKVYEIYMKEFNENFQNILLEPKEIFIKNINLEVDLILNEVFQKREIERKEIKEYQKMALEKLNEEYDKNYNLLNLEWQNYIKNPKNYKSLSRFRKHCIKTDNEAFHPCETEKAKLIEIYDKETNEVTHIICVECKQCYKNNLISLLCDYCKVEYYSCILPKEQDINILPSTWEKYHCGGMINETMKCIKCQNVLYYNLNERYLVCLNKKCNFRARPESIIWNCVFCKKEFKSDAKIYNPMEMFMIKRSIRKALLFKEPSYPSELPCCKVTPEELIFYHKDECKGELYRGNLYRKEIIVCSKCRALNFADKFIWTCPLCHKRFRNYKSVWGNLFKKKEYLIEDDKNRYNDENEKDFDFLRRSNRLNTSSSLIFGDKNRLTYLNNNNLDNSINLETDVNSSKNDLKKNKKQYKTLLDLIEKRNSNKKVFPVNKSLNYVDKNSLSNRSLYHVKNSDNELNEVINICSTNDGSLSGNSNQTTNKIKKLNFNSINEDESSTSTININQEKANSIKSKEMKKEGLDKINMVESINKQHNNIEENSYDKSEDSSSSVGDLTSIASLNSNTFQNILTNPEQLDSILKECKIPEFDVNDYIYLNPIGEGSFGKIYLVENSFDNSKYALKKIICHDLNEVKQIQKEIELVYSKPHKNIMKIIKVQYKALDITTYSIYILMELALGDWNMEIKKRAKKNLMYKENEIIIILNQIVDACFYLENEGIAHRDIKPQNILLFENNVFKLADFGEAKKLSETIQQCTLRGSELYMSPVLYNGLKLNQKNVAHNAFKSDVFSLGYCLLYALNLNLKILNEIREINHMNVIYNIIQRYLRRNYSKNLIYLISKMLELNEEERFSFNDIKQYLNEKYC